MTSTHEPYPNGRRRIDKVLSEGYADDLAGLDLDELRSRRREAEQEEADLSYLRRMLQGRMDILRAELARRAGGGGKIVEHLSGVLADSARSDHGLGRSPTWVSPTSSTIPTTNCASPSAGWRASSTPSPRTAGACRP